jgi:hypothetical protein
MYEGPERRRHRVYVTRNTEYHTRDGLCVAVRDRQSGEFYAHHYAVGKPLREGIRYDDGGRLRGASLPDKIEVGDALHFSKDPMSLDVLTSPLEAIRRPSRNTVDTYPALG